MSRNANPDPQRRSPPLLLQRNLARTPFSSRIPNLSARKMFKNQELAKPTRRMPGWDGFYGDSNCDLTDMSERIHPFLTDGLLPPKLRPEGGVHIIASAGGLLLYTKRNLVRPEPIKKTEPMPIHQTGPAATVAGRRRGRPKPRPRYTDTVESSHSHSSKSQREGCSCCTCWERLFVTNIESFEERELPSADIASLELESLDYYGVQVSMVANEDNYKVVLTYRTRLCVYNSTSRSWSYFRFPTQGEWGLDQILDRENHMICKRWGWVSTHVTLTGCLYFADVVTETQASYTLRVFKVDCELGTWTLHNSVTLRKRHWSFLPRIPSRDPCGHPCGDLCRAKDGIRSVELVNCMGTLYAVIPSRVNEHLTTEFTSVRTLEELMCDHVAGLEVLPIQFHILRLNWKKNQNDGFEHRVQRILIPQTLCDVERRGEDLLERFLNVYGQKEGSDLSANIFWCAAEGSVIFVACEDYLTQYDVVSGESKTGIFRNRWIKPYPHRTYSPNPHLWP